MKRHPPPLRFLVLAIGGWVLARTAVIAPDWWVEQGTAAPAAVTAAWARPPAAAAAFEMPARTADVAPFLPRSRVPWLPGAAPDHADPAPRRPVLQIAFDEVAMPVPDTRLRLPAAAIRSPALPFASPRPPVPRTSRWSASTWLLVRGNDQAALAHQGTLGGSQAGLRLAYRLNGDAARPLAVSARLYAPLRDRRAAEAALGLDWQPLASVPVHLLLERRQSLLGRGRSAFALSFYGGVSAEPVRGVRVEAWGQAGLVGTSARDLFADGAARAALPVGRRLEVGAGLWGGAQPGAARLDAGPLVALRLPGLGETVRVSAEWRLRIAGDARPGSGPALTIGSDF